MSDHAWCSDPARDEAVRAVEDGRMGPLPTLEECIETARAMMPKSGSATSAPEPENKVDGMRTERVTLDVTHGSSLSAVMWNWRGIVHESLRCGESVRVVEDRTGTDMGNGVFVASTEEVLAMCRETEARLTAERDAAIRERDAAKEECEMLREQMVIRCTTAANLHGVIRERDAEIGTLKARVAELEAAAAPAANAGGGLNQPPQPPRGWLTSDERESVEILLDAIAPSGGNIYRDEIATLRALLARSTPPEVVVPVCPYDGYTLLKAEYVWGKCVAAFAAAIAAAGVKVKEVGRE